MRKELSRWIFLVAMCVACFAQTMGTGTIRGTVTDASGSIIAGATVKVKNQSTGMERSAVTGSSGTYVFPALQVGKYTITTSSPGFKTLTQENVNLDVDTNATVNVSLPVGQSEQSMTVTDTPPALQTASGELGTIATGAQVSELSFNGRNFSQILALGTGIASQNTGHRMGVGQEGNPLMSVNGGTLTSTKYTYDGVWAMDPAGGRGLNLFPPMDAIEEVQIKTSNFSADSGSNGYGMVNAVTKSGGAKFHGDFYEVLGNAVVDARNFFDNSRAPFVQNIFGVTLGGPVFIPQHYNTGRNKTFFFVSEGWNRRQGPQIESYNTPPQGTFTAQTIDGLMRTGNFGGVTGTIKDPNSGQAFSGNIIPTSRLDPNAKILASRFYPLPNRTGSPNFVTTPDSATDWREDLFRFDHNFSDSVILTLRYGHDTWTQDQAVMKPSNFAFPTGSGTFSKPGHNAIARLMWTANPTTVNVFTAGFSRVGITQLPNLDAVSRAGLNIPTIFNSNYYGSIPDINISGYGGIGVSSGTNPNNNMNNLFEWKDDLTHVAGNHSFKFGFDFERVQHFLADQSNTEGTFTFNGSFTGNAVADFMLGDAFTYTEASTAPNGYMFSNAYEMYAQDDWKVRPNLTLNLGLRWSIFASSPVGYDKYNHISDFIPALYNPAQAPVINPDGSLKPGTGNPLNGIVTPTALAGLNLPRSLRDTRYVMPAPRFGFAWSPANNTKTVIRGGYGIFYSWDTNNQESLRKNPPFSSSANISRTSLSNPAGGASVLFPANLTAFNPNNQYPGVQQWSLGLQRELPFHFVLSASYVGNHAVHLTQSANLNQPQPLLAVASGAVNVNTVRPYAGYGTITFLDRTASAHYNALQVSAKRRFDNGFGFELSYTYSNAIAFGFGQNPFVQPDEKGLSNLSQPHNLTVNYVYALPFFKNSKRFAHAALAGWEWSGIAVFSSGFPFTVTISGDRAGVGGGTQRPNVVGTPTIFGTVSQYFDTSAFALQPLGMFGNEGINAVRGPGISDNYTMNFYKNFKFRENSALRIGGEVFNIFNHPNFSAVGNVFGSATFGHITAALDPREIQFSARLTF